MLLSQKSHIGKYSYICCSVFLFLAVTFADLRNSPASPRFLNQALNRYLR